MEPLRPGPPPHTARAGRSGGVASHTHLRPTSGGQSAQRRSYRQGQHALRGWFRPRPGRDSLPRRRCCHRSPFGRTRPSGCSLTAAPRPVRDVRSGVRDPAVTGARTGRQGPAPGPLSRMCRTTAGPVAPRPSRRLSRCEDVNGGAATPRAVIGVASLPPPDGGAPAALPCRLPGPVARSRAVGWHPGPCRGRTVLRTQCTIPCLPRSRPRS